MGGSLPAGTVTLLFTDIESSSERWEANAVRMRAMLARHDELLRTVIGGQGGVVFKHLGDGMAAVFATAPAAMAAAAAIVEAMEAENWDDERALLVRVGLHTGSGSPVGGDYFGPTVNRAARVMAAANGAQVVCSAATRSLCPEGVFRDAGIHELAGVGPEHLYVLAEVGAGADLALRTVSARVTNLPIGGSSFVGRTAEVSEVVALVAPGRLMTLVGPGGVGKTRLAIETARRLLDRFADGVWFCELAAVVDPEAVPAIVAATMGVRQQPGMDLIEAIGVFLERRRCLVVLDNCEHVLGAVAVLARRLLGRDGVALLATSREQVGVHGEQLWPVLPLEVDKAVELFVDRCRERDPHFRLDEESEAAVRQIGHALDGIPLALELAAARTSALSPTAIADRLGDRFRLLRGGRRGDRYQTMRDALQWSYDLLEPAERALFSRLAVFAGGFDLAAAEAICANDVVEEFEVVDLVVALVDKSMVQRARAGSERFSMLETLRQFGEDQLHATGAAAEYRGRHARYFRDLVVSEDARIFGPAEAAAWVALDGEWNNLRYALSYLSAAGDMDAAATLVLGLAFFASYSQRFELGDWAAGLIAHPSAATLSAFHSADLAGVCSWQEWCSGEVHRSAQRFDEAVERDDLDPVYYWTTVMAYLLIGDLARAGRAVTQLSEAIGDAGARASYCATIMTPYYLNAAHRYDEAVAAADRALALATQAASPSGIAHALHVRGLCRLQVDLGAARRDEQRAFDTAIALSPSHLIADGALNVLARVAVASEDNEESLRACRRAIVSAVGADYFAGLSSPLQSAAVALARTGDPATSLRLLHCTSHHGYRNPQSVQQHVAQLAGPDLLTAIPEENLSMRDAAKLALDAIDRQTSLIAANKQPTA